MASMSDDTKIGLVGLGGLTSRIICGVLGQPGYRVQVYDVDGVKVEALKHQSIKVGLSAKDVAASSDVLVYTVSNPDQLEDFLFDPQRGVLSGKHWHHLSNHVNCPSRDY